MSARLYVTEWDNTIVAELVDYERFTLAQRFNAPGRFSMTLPRETLLELITRKRKVLLQYNDRLVSGVVLSVDLRPGATKGTVAGMTDLLLLAMRAAFPEPSGDFSSQAYDTRTGAVESVVKGYVRDNASGDALISARAFPFTVAADGGRGIAVTGNARFHNLLALCQKLIAAAGNNMRMDLAAGVFDVQPISDLRGAPFLADWLGANWGMAWRAPTATHVIAGGAGQGTARLFYEQDDPEGLYYYWRSEIFYDLRNEDDAAALKQAAIAKLHSSAGRYGVIVTMSTQGYGKDYREGDLVTAQVRGIPFDGAIEEVKIEYDQGNGWRETVGVGVEASPLLWDAISKASLSEAIENLEVSQ